MPRVWWSFLTLFLLLRCDIQRGYLTSGDHFAACLISDLIAKAKVVAIAGLFQIFQAHSVFLDKASLLVCALAL